MLSAHWTINQPAAALSRQTARCARHHRTVNDRQGGVEAFDVLQGGGLELLIGLIRNANVHYPNLIREIAGFQVMAQQARFCAFKYLGQRSTDLAQAHY
jgi:hypothetical protein